MPTKKIDMLLEIWAMSLLALCGEPLFANQKDLYHIINSTSISEVKWESFVVWYANNGRDGQDSNMAPWMLDSYDVWYRDPRKVIHNVLARTDLIGQIDYIPYQEYDSTNNQRHWEDFMSGAWVWNKADRIISEDPTTAGATLIPIILGSDKTMWTSDNSKGLMKVYITAIEGYVPQYIIFTFRAFLEFCYLICWNVITQQMLVEIDDALRCFHLYREVFQNAGVVDTFSLPWQHAMKNYYHLICQFGTPNSLCSSITESKHIKAVKQPYQHTNYFQALRQMLLINQRLYKLIAMHADFKERGQHPSNADDPCDQVGESHDMANKIEEQAGSYEEELGDAVDAPRLVEAHVSLARTHHMSQPSTLYILRC
ncbi:hypothetical protein M404DRAFT_34391 [Pisolithus tinctorius Marx 270]|uniref:Uncharacterized protein n=1 Tax=Pisolithus tinctorius Marx 270 TaxID=870435 RepID=A0A0C3IDK1_PISTI|nr:hypothetical protein M404DRAFT_34391 [Pisolithus tinctorius Marx 270]